jgi:hypothetical protein
VTRLENQSRRVPDLKFFVVAKIFLGSKQAGIGFHDY